MKTINYVVELTPRDIIAITTGEKLYKELDEDTCFVLILED